MKETVFNVNYVVEKLLPPIASDTTSYPDSCLSVWIEALDVLMHCGSAADPSFSIHASGSSGLEMRQICPNVVLLEFGARILEMEGLRNLVYHGCSVDLRAKVGDPVVQLRLHVRNIDQCSDNPVVFVCSTILLSRNGSGRRMSSRQIHHLPATTSILGDILRSKICDRGC